MFTLKIPINKCYLVYKDSMIPLEGVRNYVLCASKEWCAYSLSSDFFMHPKCKHFLADCVLKHFISSTLPPLLCVHLSQVVLRPQYVKPQPFFQWKLDYIFTKMISIFLVWIALECLCVFFYSTNQNSLLIPIICFFLDLKERI